MSAEPAVNTNAENPAGTAEKPAVLPLTRFLCLKLIRLMRRGSAARTVSWLLAGVCLTASFLGTQQQDGGVRFARRYHPFLPDDCAGRACRTPLPPG